MISLRTLVAGCGLTLLVCISLHAAERNDPLSPLEIDQLRDAAYEPDQRLALFVTFARARLTALEQCRSDPKVTDRAAQTHDRLQDFLDVYDELNDNVDTYTDRKADLRKVLKTIIEADTEFQAKLRALKESADSKKDEVKQYEFVLSDALDAVDRGVEDHRQLLAEQEAAAAKRKKK